MAAGADSRLWRVAYEEESSWGEEQSMGSPIELPVTGDRPDIGFELPQEEVNPTRRHAHDGVRDIPTVWGGTFSFTTLLTGLGSDPSGSISSNTVIDLLEHALGKKDVSSEGTEVDTAWSDGTSGDVVGGVFPNGALLRIGTSSPRDGRGNGAAYRLKENNGGSLELLTATESAPNAGDKVNAMGMVFPDELPEGPVTPLRFLLASRSQQYIAHGCFIQGISFSSFQTGQVPRVTFTVGVSWVERVSGQFSGTAPTRLTGAPIANGQFWHNDRGTSDFKQSKIRDCELNVELNVTPVTGPGGASRNQGVVGAFRHSAPATMQFAVDAESAGTDTWGDWFRDGEGYKHVLYTLSAADKRSVAIYMPKVKPSGNVPIQEDMDGRNVQRIEVQALTENDGSSDLEKAAFVLGMG